jgi:transposase-like protein
MGLSRRKFTREFKLAAVRRLESGISMAEVARGLEVSPNLLHRWSEGQIAELERKIGRQAVEIDFLKGCLQRIEEQRMLQVSTGNPQSAARSAKK